jgi:WD40 repeat protein
MDDFRRRSPKSPPVESLPVAVWVRLHGDLAFYLAEHQAQEASLLGFYHRSFLEAITAHCLAARETRQARHQHLADWFGKQAWFLDPATEKTGPAQGAITDPPNLRKASELPWHLYRTAGEFDPECCQEAVWQPLVDILCDIWLVEAKVRSGLLFELQEDYRLALDALPEMVSEVRARREQEEFTARWAADLIAYARQWTERRERLERDEEVADPEPRLPEPVSVCRMWTEEEIQAECRRISEKPTRLDRVRTFAQFVRSVSHGLSKFGSRPGFALQQAHGFARSGPVAAAAEAQVAAGVDAALILEYGPFRPAPNPHPALLQTLDGHTGSVTSVSVTPDGGRAVSAGEGDMSLRVWDLATGACLRVLEGHEMGVNCVSVTPDGGRAVSGSGHYTQAKDRTVRVWDLATGACLRVLEGHRWTVYCVSVTPDGERAVSGDEHEIRFWDLATGRCLRVLEGHTDTVLSVNVTPDGGRAVSGSADKTLRVWDLATGTCLRVLEGHTDLVGSVSVTPDGRWAVSSGGWDKTLRFWDLATGVCLRVLEGHTDFVRSVSVTPDGRRAVSGSFDGTLRIWDLASGRCLRVLEGHPARVSGVSVTSDGGRAVSGCEDTTVRVWDLATGACLRPIEEPEASLSGVSVTLDWERAVSRGSSDGTLQVWDLATGRRLRVLEGHTSWVWSVGLTPDGGRAVSGSGDKTVRVWDLATGACLRVIEGHTDFVTSVSVTPDGRWAVSGSHDGTLRIWDLATGQCLRVLENDGRWVKCVSVTPDGELAVSAGSSDGTLDVWDLGTGRHLRVIKAHWSGVDSLGVTLDGRQAVSVGYTTLQVWDLATGRCLRVLKGHTSGVENVSVTPDGGRAVSASYDRTIRVWDLVTGACLCALVEGDPVDRISQVRADGCFAFATRAGRVSLAKIVGLPLGPPFTTGVRLWQWGERAEVGQWEGGITAFCLWCGRRFPVAPRTLDVVGGITRAAQLRPNQSPCLDLPREAWDEPRLSSECPSCRKSLRFNPFIVDNQGRGP